MGGWVGVLGAGHGSASQARGGLGRGGIWMGRWQDEGQGKDEGQDEGQGKDEGRGRPHTQTSHSDPHSDSEQAAASLQGCLCCSCAALFNRKERDQLFLF